MSTEFAINFGDIQKAAQAIEQHIVHTPFLRSETFSSLLASDVFLKFENLQFTASFKERGALNRILNLSENEKSLGVIAASAGNHAQGVAYHAARFKIPSKIVMPRFAPLVKV
ncbi:MAG: pyridoxal-phosphate dependent enzyme, partial [Burkholderiales bacterium]